MVTKKSITELVDPLLADAYDAEQMSRVVSVVSMCINESSTERPKMSQVRIYVLAFMYIQLEEYCQHSLSNTKPHPHLWCRLLGY